MERQTNELVDRNREEEQRLRREKIRAETALNAKIAQYDEYMSVHQKELEELTALFNQESSDYAVLKEYFDRVDADIQRSAEESYILQSVQRREDFGMYVLNTAVTYIQKIVRGRQVRAVVSKMLAKAKKGKKGKGKKK